MTRLRLVALVVIGSGSLVVGVWALGFPASFYADFPGAGRTWVAVDGPYNEHLVRDVGALNLALAFVAAMALVTRDVTASRTAGGAALIFGAPHLLYHAMNLDGFRTGDAVAMIVSLTMVVLAAVVALLPERSTEELSRAPERTAS